MTRAEAAAEAEARTFAREAGLVGLTLCDAKSLGKGRNDGHEPAHDRGAAHINGQSVVHRIVPFDPTSTTTAVIHHKPTLLRNQTLNNILTFRIIPVVFRFPLLALVRAGALRLCVFCLLCAHLSVYVHRVIGASEG